MLPAASLAIKWSPKTHNLLFISREITVVVLNVITRSVTRHCKFPLLHLVEGFSLYLNTDASCRPANCPLGAGSRYSIYVTSAHITWTSVPASEQGHKPAEQKLLQSGKFFFFLAEDTSQLIQGPAGIPDDLATQL